MKTLKEEILKRAGAKRRGEGEKHWYTEGLKYGNIRVKGQDTEFNNKNELVWNKGTWVSGVWKDGAWHDGIWQKGTWIEGTWFDGRWLSGNWKGGVWLGGIWSRGTWEEGVWHRGWIYDPKKIGNFKEDWKWDGPFVESKISPKEYFEKKAEK